LLQGPYGTVCAAMGLTVKALRANDQKAAEEVWMLKDEIREQAGQWLARKAARLTAEAPEYPVLVRLQRAFVDWMRRIYRVQRRIVEEVLPASLSGRE
jgi:hypothetical protein